MFGGTPRTRRQRTDRTPSRGPSRGPVEYDAGPDYTADDERELVRVSPDFIRQGWNRIDLQDAFQVIDDALDYMDEHGYMS